MPESHNAATSELEEVATIRSGVTPSTTIASSITAQSLTLRAIGPAWSSELAKATMP